MKKGDTYDPKALIAEAYNIDGITVEECRSIFLDWALSIPTDADTQVYLDVLITRHADEDHPMSEVLKDGKSAAQAPRRRGGWRGRR